jgi:chemotaxis protein CheY-P-specific phosphatase CheC
VVEAVQPRAQVARRGGVDKVLQPNGSAFSVHFTVEGGARLRWMMHVTQEGATLMGGLLLGSPLKGVMDDGTMYESALAEMSNIVVSSYVGGLAAAVGLTLVPSIPYVKPTMSETMVAAFGDLDAALFLVTDLRLPGVRYAGRIVAAPVDESLGRLLSMLGAE